MKSLVVLVLGTCFVVLAQCGPQNNTQQGERRKVARTRTPEEKIIFTQWRKKHRKQFRNQEEEKEAMEKVLTNKEKIDAHNKLFEQGEVTFKRGLWEHSDMSDDDKKKYLMGLAVPPETRSMPVAPNIPQYPPGPASVDWKARGLVGPVEDQGWCGSCWAFSASGVVESVLRKRNITTETAPQQMVDCSKIGCWGCSSGWPKRALDYLKWNGIASESSYPYVGYDQNCSYSQNMSVGFLNETFNIQTQGNETWLKDIVAAVGPVSIVMCVNESFGNYQSGVYYQKDCGMDLNHAMLITGYGTDPVYGDYWHVKNSWGVTWGEKGYARVARNAKNMCNIAYYAVYAT